MASNANEADEKTEEYESDPDDLPLPAMRRREAASDDEEESDGGEDLPQKKNETAASRNVRSDGESDGQGGAEAYDEDDVDDYDEEEEEYDELGEEFEEELEEENGNDSVEPRQQGELEGENREGNRDESRDEENKEGEKKENEPYAVPTSGAFYMHDDRFQENARGGRRRRMYSGGRKIWNPKDERAWVHDRFEEMIIHDSRRDDDRRRPRGRYRGRGGSGGRGPRKVGGAGDRGGGYPRGGRGSRSYYDDGQNHNNKSTRSVRGRGQRRYEPVNRNNPRNQPPQEKQMSQKANEQGSNQRATSTSTNNIRQQSQAQTSNAPSSSLPKKLSSSLNSASPPFYPSNSSNNNQDFSTGTRRGAQNSGPVLSDNRGKSIAVGSTLAPNSATTTGRVQGRGVMGNDSQISSVSSQAPTSMAQHKQAVAGNHQFRPTSLQPASGTGSTMGDDGVTSGSPINKLKGVVSAPKGKASGTGGLMYGGAQVIGTTGPMSMPHGEPGFPGTPALMPVMPFSGQPHGVPTVGMALPGYVAQSQLGFGNSEMTWVPVLAGAAGSLGGSYCPPYIALDGGYYNNPRPSSQISSSAPTREAGAAKSSDGTKSSQKPEVPTEELGQRQNKPRRYSEMNFGQ